jgi:hypothetical protein
MNDKNLKLGLGVVVPVTEKGAAIQKDGIVKGLNLNDDNSITVDVEFSTPVTKKFGLDEVINPNENGGV